MIECTKTVRWQAGRRVKVGSVSILFIDQTFVSGCTSVLGHSGWVSAEKRPCAMVVRINNVTHIDGFGISPLLTMDQLRDRVPDLDEAVAQL